MIITMEYLHEVGACSRATECLEGLGEAKTIDKQFLQQWLRLNEGIEDPTDYDSDCEVPKWMTDGKYDLIMLIGLLCGAEAVACGVRNCALTRKLFGYLDVEYPREGWNFTRLIKALEKVAKSEKRLINAVLQCIEFKERR